MKIYPVYDYVKSEVDINIVSNIIETLKKNSSSDKHFFTEDRIGADVYLFFTTCLEFSDIKKIKKHPLVRTYPGKCFLICDKDISYPILPGIYAALPNQFFYDRLFVTGFYLSATNPYISKFKDDKRIEPKYLASFQGGLSSRLRELLSKIVFGKSTIITNFVKPQWQDFYAGTGFADSGSNYLQDYARLISGSKFILCPRGNGISSYRLFETFEAGRVPVIISDQFVPPVVVQNWEKGVLQIKESELNRIEKKLLEAEKNWLEMKSNVEAIYQKYYQLSSRVDFIGESLEYLLAKGAPIQLWQLQVYWIYIEIRLKFYTTLKRVKLFIGQQIKFLKNVISR